MHLSGPVKLTQHDIRQLQLAKGAISAGIGILLKQYGAIADDVEQISLAGSFGNYTDIESAARIGLIGFPRERVKPAGNTALLGAKIALCAPEGSMAYADVRSRVTHIPLSSAPSFQDRYVDEMAFPDCKSIDD